MNGPTQSDVGRDPGHQQDDVDHDGAEEQVHRVEPRRRDPVEFFRGMMDRVIFPESAAVKQPVQPVQQEVRQDQEQHRLEPERQFGQGPMAIVVKGDHPVGVVNVEDHAGAALKERRIGPARRSAAPYNKGDWTPHRIVMNPLIGNLLCSRTGRCSHVYATELTAPQAPDLRVAPWSRC